MPAAILHFGRDILECFTSLKRKGYSVDCFEGPVDLDHLRHSGIEYDLVSSADIENDECRHAAGKAREHLVVPYILFRTRLASHSSGIVEQFAAADDSHHDLVIATGEAPQLWIPALEKLIAQGRRLRHATERIIANSIWLRFEAAAAIEKTHLEIRRARLQQELNAVPTAGSDSVPDRILKCKSCGAAFIFSAAEQLFSQVHNLMDTPDICANCRSSNQ